MKLTREKDHPFTCLEIDRYINICLQNLRFHRIDIIRLSVYTVVNIFHGGISC